MALIYFDDNGQRQELHSCPWQTNLENRQEIADYLIRRLQEKNYSADTWSQKTILGKILKRALFDLNETYEIRYEFKTLYRKKE